MFCFFLKAQRHGCILQELSKEFGLEQVTGKPPSNGYEPDSHGTQPQLTHVGKQGEATMVDVSQVRRGMPSPPDLLPAHKAANNWWWCHLLSAAAWVVNARAFAEGRHGQVCHSILPRGAGAPCVRACGTKPSGQGRRAGHRTLGRHHGCQAHLHANSFVPSSASNQGEEPLATLVVVLCVKFVGPTVWWLCLHLMVTTVS
jgi:hypothetical protein